MPKIILPAKLDNLDKLIQFTSSFAEENGVSPKRIMEIELSVEEALVNVFSYAYPENEGDVELKCMTEGESLKIMVLDEGIPFNVLSVDDPDITETLAERQIGGLGIFFIKKMANEVNYERKDGKNILSMNFNQ